MTADTREDLDSLLGGLEVTPPGPAPGAAESADPPGTESPGTAPPPMPAPRRRVAAGEHKGRTEFPDLFSSDTTGVASVHSSLEEKIDYFREKLRRAEAQIGRLREAWEIRESEMDAAEAQIGREAKRGDETARALQQMQAFLEQKKIEFEAYGKKVAQAFADKDASLAALREELDKTLLETTQERDEAADARAALEHDLALREEAAEKLKAAVQTLREAVEARDAELARLQDELSQAVGERDVEIGRLNDELARASAATHAQADEVAEAHQAIEVRDTAIQKLKAAVLQRDARLEELVSELASASGNAAEARDSKAGVESALKARDATIAKLQEGLRAAVSRCETLEVDLAAAQAHSAATNRPRARATDPQLERVRKALEVAGVLLGDLEEADGQGGLGAEAAELIRRLHRALDIAREAAALVD